MRKPLLLPLLALLMGCESDDIGVPTIEITPRDYRFVVHAKGELLPSESVPITLPGNVRMAFNIAWLIPEYSEVKKGDVIARFDDEEILADRIDSELEIVKNDLELETFRRTSEIDRTRIDHEAVRVDGEMAISKSFTDVDPRLFSRNEIIDALADVDYLEVADDYYAWQALTHEQRASAEEQVILAGKLGSQSKYDKQTAALNMVELRSPADGTFIYARTPWGDKLAKGSRVFAGRPVGMLPVRGKVRARLYVTESDAVGLANGQPVALRLDSAVDHIFNAEVASVSPVASPRRKDDPQKFFIVEADIADIDADLMRVGSSVEAEIITAEISDAILIPEQSIVFSAESAFVYVMSGDQPTLREVQTGLRSPSLVQITRGLEPGEQISLAPPDEREVL